MPRQRSGFFNSKEAHPWSRVKDRILGSYLVAYLAKVSRLNKKILLVDAFAGPGRTDNGEDGSPLLICRAAADFAQGKYHAFFVNKNQKHHEQLQETLKTLGYENSTTAILGDGPSVLEALAPMLNRQTVFLYIDPFGVECEFSALEAFLHRSKNCSTEILINLNMPALHRLAGKDATKGGREVTGQLKDRHEQITRILGGDSWKEHLFTGEDTKKRERGIVEGYEEKLASTGYLTYTGSCPIRESPSSQTKYFMIFASRHPDAMLLFNDDMCRAVNIYFTEREMGDTLFANESWEFWRDPDIRKLRALLVDFVEKYPHYSRKDLRKLFIQEHFAQYTQSEFNKAVSTLVETDRIICSTPIKNIKGSVRKTKRLNDNCVLEPCI